MIKYFLLLGMNLTASICWASAFEENKSSLSIGPAAISSEIGYSVEVTSPYMELVPNANNPALSFQFSQFLFSGMPNNSETFEEQSYYRFQVSTVNKLWSIRNLDVYFKPGLFIIPASNVSTTGTGGLNFLVGSEFFRDQWIVSVVSELGYSLPLTGRASNFRNQTYARGIVMAIAIKVHLF